MPKTVQCIGYGEVEIIERGPATGLSRVRLSTGMEVSVITSYLPPESVAPAEPQVVSPSPAPKK